MARRSADAESSPNTKSAAGLRRSDRFLIGLHQYDRVVFVSHLQPDPDSLGSMLGLAHLVESRLQKPTIITRDGLISRAENRAMVEVLHLDLIPIEEVQWGTNDAVVMVDSQPRTGRHTFPENVPLFAVIGRPLLEEKEPERRGASSLAPTSTGRRWRGWSGHWRADDPGSGRRAGEAGERAIPTCARGSTGWR